MLRVGVASHLHGRPLNEHLSVRGKITLYECVFLLFFFFFYDTYGLHLYISQAAAPNESSE